MEISDSVAFPVDVVQARLRAFEGGYQPVRTSIAAKGFCRHRRADPDPDRTGVDLLEFEITESTLTECVLSQPPSPEQFARAMMKREARRAQ